MDSSVSSVIDFTVNPVPVAVDTEMNRTGPLPSRIHTLCGEAGRKRAGETGNRKHALFPFKLI